MPSLFAAFLMRHYRLGTGRNAWLDRVGYKLPQGRKWEPKEFAEACGVTDRAERYWRTGEKLPDDTNTIERVLFGDAAAEAERRELREVFDLDRQQRGQSAPSSPLAGPNIRKPDRCLGRDAAIAGLVAAMLRSEGGGIALVFGGPGFGKTTVTQEVAVHPDILRRFGSRRWFVELTTVENAAGIVEAIAATIGLERTAGKDAVLARLSGKPALLVLDNLETPWHADPPATEALLRELRDQPSLALIASLRGDEPIARLRWDAAIPLEPLDRRTAKQLFLEIAPKISAQDPDLDFFLDRAAGIPLAVFLIASRASPHANLVRLQRAWKRHGLSAVTEPGSEGSRQGDLVACIEFSLKSTRLHDPGKRLFALLGQLRGGMGMKDQDALLGDDAFAAEDQLRAVGLLWERDERIDLLSPIREVAALKHAPSGEDTRRWVTHYLTLARDHGALVGKDGGAAAVVRLNEELPNIGAAMLQAAADEAGRADALSVLPGLSKAMRYTGAAADPMLQALAAICAQAGDQRGEASCLIVLAGTARVRSDKDHARAYYQSAQNRLDNAPDDKLEADCLWGLADIARTQDRHEEARGLFEQARELYVRAGRLTDEPHCLWGLAEIARMQDRHEEARGLFDQARKLHVRAGYLTGEAQCLWGLAAIARMQDRHEEARDLFEQARELYVRAGYPAGEADCLWGLADIARVQDRHEEARGLFEQARELYVRAGVLTGETQCLCGLAAIARMQHHHEEARDLFEQAREQFVRAGGLTGEADCLWAWPISRGCSIAMRRRAVSLNKRANGLSGWAGGSARRIASGAWPISRGCSIATRRSAVSLNKRANYTCGRAG
jgi:tetratricopeptide (TPR) repeat protein